MKTKRITLSALGTLATLAGIGLALFGSGCGSDEEPKDQVLFADSFESDSTVFRTGWGHSRYDSVRVVPGDCPGGQSHAVQLYVKEGCGSGYSCDLLLYRDLPEAETGDSLELSAWVRVTRAGARGGVRFCPVFVIDGWTSCTFSVSSTDSVAISRRETWTRVTMQFTNESTGHPPHILLWAESDSGAAAVLFDRVEVKRLAKGSASGNPVSF